MDFPRTLSLLRQEKKISQRKAAGELGVSQALLSHYENGVREPGLSFVVRAADFYGVSADFLLGRTMARDGGAILADDLMDSSQEKDNVLRGSAMVMLQKKLLVNSLSLLYEQLGKESAQLTRAVSDYLSLSFYKTFRLLYEMDESASRKAFAAPKSVFSELCDCEMKRCESVLRQLAADGKMRRWICRWNGCSRIGPGWRRRCFRCSIIWTKKLTRKTKKSEKKACFFPRAMVI